MPEEAAPRLLVAITLAGLLAAGSAPACEKTGMPWRKIISVGIEVMPAAPARACWSSVSTLPQAMSACFALADS